MKCHWRWSVVVKQIKHSDNFLFLHITKKPCKISNILVVFFTLRDILKQPKRSATNTFDAIYKFMYMYMYISIKKFDYWFQWEKKIHVKTTLQSKEFKSKSHEPFRKMVNILVVNARNRTKWTLSSVWFKHQFIIVLTLNDSPKAKFNLHNTTKISKNRNCNKRYQGEI